MDCDYLCGKTIRMLQLQVLRQDTEQVKQRLAIKHFADLSLVDTIISLDDQRRKLQLEFDTTQSGVNAASKEIGMLMGKGEKEAAESKKQEVSRLKELLQPISEQLAATEKNYRKNW